MKYKHTRKEIEAMLVEAVKVGCGYYSMPDYIFHLIKDSLLAQKEDRKECKHIPDREVGLNVWSCKKCRCCFVHKSTPSPLEIEEIEEISKFHTNTTFKWVKLVDKVNQLISNQKKLYQLIKEKL